MIRHITIALALIAGLAIGATASADPVITQESIVFADGGELVVRSNGDGTVGLELLDASGGRAAVIVYTGEVQEAIDLMDVAARDTLLE